MTGPSNTSLVEATDNLFDTSNTNVEGEELDDSIFADMMEALEESPEEVSSSLKDEPSHYSLQLRDSREREDAAFLQASKVPKRVPVRVIDHCQPKPENCGYGALLLAFKFGKETMQKLKEREDERSAVAKSNNLSKSTLVGEKHAVSRLSDSPPCLSPNSNPRKQLVASVRALDRRRMVKSFDISDEEKGPPKQPSEQYEDSYLEIIDDDKKLQALVGKRPKITCGSNLILHDAQEDVEKRQKESSSRKRKMTTKSDERTLPTQKTPKRRGRPPKQNVMPGNSDDIVELLAETTPTTTANGSRRRKKK